MSSRYIEFPIDVDAEDRVQRAFDYLKTKNPAWEPAEGNIDTWILEAGASEAADIARLVQAVPKGIFRYFGQILFGIPAIAETSATATIRIYATDSLGHTFPAGMQVGIRDALGNLIPFTLVNAAVIPAASNNVDNVLIVAAVAGSASSGLGTVGGPVELIDTNQYVDHITVTTITTGGVDEETDSAYLTRLAQRLQLMSPRPITERDYAILLRDIAGIQRAVAIDGYNPYYNMLTADESSFETSIANHTGTNASLTNGTMGGGDGAKALSLAAIAAADMSAQLNVAQAKIIKAGDVVSVLASFRAGTTGRNCKVGIRWYDASNTVLGTDYGALVADVNTSYTQASVTSTAPANATKAVPVYFVTAPAAGEVHHVDKALIGKSNISVWAIGPATATGQEKMVTVASLDSNGTPVSAAVRLAGEIYLDSLRELNFIVNSIDATVNQIDVTTTYTVLPNYSLGDVQSRVITAIQNFLSPKYWGVARDDDLNDPSTWTNTKTVYYLELAAAINAVPGVDRVTALTIGLHGGSLSAVDLALTGQVPIPNPNTINATGTYP